MAQVSQVRGGYPYLFFPLDSIPYYRPYPVLRMTITREERLRIGQVADAAGVTVQTLRYYERRGLLRSPRRTSSGYRIYDADTVDTIGAIKRAQSLGFTIAEIRQLMSLHSRRRSPGAVVEMLAEKIREIDGKIRDLRLMRRSLQKGYETCKCGGDLSHCDALAELGVKEDSRVSRLEHSRPRTKRRKHENDD